MSKNWIRNSLVERKSYPILSISDLIDTLKMCNLDAISIKLSQDKFMNLDVPFIAYVQEEVIGNCYILIKAVNNFNVNYYIPDKGDVIEPLEIFFSRWQGVVILFGNNKDYNNELPDGSLEYFKSETYKANCVKTISNFISAEDCKSIIDYTESISDYARSSTMDEKGNIKFGNNRTSFSIGLKNDEMPLFENIREKVAEYLNVSKLCIEDLQCVRYSTGQFFRPHLDSSTVLRRKHTLLVYLNDNYTGGETYFPELHLRVQPTTGKALHFLNEDNYGNNIYYSRHAGLPVREGIKYACNIWVKHMPF